jgi:hypothetical protein
MAIEFFKDANSSTHSSNKKKNDRLSHIMATLPSTTQVKSVHRVDTEADHGWEINSV